MKLPVGSAKRREADDRFRREKEESEAKLRAEREYMERRLTREQKEMEYRLQREREEAERKGSGRETNVKLGSDGLRRKEVAEIR